MNCIRSNWWTGWIHPFLQSTLVQNSLHVRALKTFCPPKISEDLCLLFCLYHYSMLYNSVQCTVMLQPDRGMSGGCWDTSACRWWVSWPWSSGRAPAWTCSSAGPGHHKSMSGLHCAVGWDDFQTLCGNVPSKRVLQIFFLLKVIWVLIFPALKAFLHKCCFQ